MPRFDTRSVWCDSRGERTLARPKAVSLPRSRCGGPEKCTPTRNSAAAATVLVIRSPEQKEGAAAGCTHQRAVDRQTVAKDSLRAFFGRRGAARLRDRGRETASSRAQTRGDRRASGLGRPTRSNSRDSVRRKNTSEGYLAASIPIVARSSRISTDRPCFMGRTLRLAQSTRRSRHQAGGSVFPRELRTEISIRRSSRDVRSNGIESRSVEQSLHVQG